MKLHLFLTAFTLMLTISDLVGSSATTQIDLSASASPQEGSPGSASQVHHSDFGLSKVNWTKATYIKNREDNGVTKTKQKEPSWKYSRDVAKEYKRFSGIRYTPIDLAEYIQRTHDEEGVALAIEELLREGLINREEAILYLENVKKELQSLRKRSEGDNTRNTSFSSPSHRIFKQPFRAFKTEESMQQAEDKRFEITRNVHVQPDVQRSPEKETGHHSLPEQLQQFQKENRKPDDPQQHYRQQIPLQLLEMLKTSHLKPPLMNISSGISVPPVKNINNGSKSMREQDNKTENDAKMMEKFVFQFAKDMFTKSMAKDNASAEQLLSHFANFLENELTDRRFSKEAQNKIMNSLSAALVESLRERLYVEN